MDLHKQTTILVTCSSGLGPFLQAELADMGFTIENCHDTGVEVTACLYDCLRLNLHLRTAYNVLYLLKEFTCETPGELYENVKTIPWENIIPVGEYFTVISRVNTASIDNTMFASLKAKDAIVDRIAERLGSRPDSGPKRDGLVFGLYWQKNKCRLYLNTSGRKLSDRSYRKIPHKAPLRESLAAGIIIAAEYDGSGPIVLPMCGSGTLAIEAALIAAKRPPGLLRSNFSFMHLKDFDIDGWQSLRNDTLKQTKKAAAKSSAQPIIATDIDEPAIEAARKNALTAGVEHLIEFEVCDFADTPVPLAEGIIILNPEYGQRLGEIQELEKTYDRIGDFFKQKCAGYTGYIFTGNPALAKKVRLRTSRRIPFYNGDIECRLLKYELYKGSKKAPRYEQY
jgi:putative N6-adenine-specific DNA methylase